MKIIKIYSHTFLLSLVLLCSVLTMSAAIPDAPIPPRLVNDFAEIFTPEQRTELEDSLTLFAKKTSNQITIVTVNSLDGQDKAQYAYEIGDKWGVGGKKLSNGVVILIKPKNDTNGEVFIATGYGLEGALPDAACFTIIDREMIPNFKNNDYYQGVVDALNVIKPIAAKEYTFEEYDDDTDALIGFGIVIFIVIFIVVISSIKDNGKNGGGSSGTFGGNRHHPGGPFIGGFGGGSSGGSSGFGGFGGGGFGGGGAGGSW